MIETEVQVFRNLALIVAGTFGVLVVGVSVHLRRMTEFRYRVVGHVAGLLRSLAPILSDLNKVLARRSADSSPGGNA